MKTLIATILLAATSMVHASDWVEVTKSSTETIFFKKNSFMVAKNDGGQVINVITARGIRKNDPEPVYFIAYVKQSECNREKGKLFFVDGEGDVVANPSFDFSTAVTGVSIVAYRICQLAEYSAKRPSL